MARIVIDKNFHPGGIAKKAGNTFTPDVRRTARPASTDSNIRSAPPIRKKGN
ncbi:hypothetical protein [Chryseobacterium luquanense]|uniref:Uncharacterized protein n=1 Tax=Chryseobacterium luquanense TaxID=2983766 RepID=A0ABT3Y845_9FLAO|nr:hypothetical protein [Chryseobacterium luquanense]MCX8534339.1 hypothetical protein [Chryseobacterium luquanense]